MYIYIHIFILYIYIDFPSFLLLFFLCVGQQFNNNKKRFFSSSLGRLRSYIALLPYKEPVKPLYSSSGVLQQFFGVVKVLYSTSAVHKEAIKRTLRFLTVFALAWD